MSKTARLIALVLLAGLCNTPGLAQQGDIHLVGASSNKQAMPGQLVQVYVEGVRLRPMPPPPLDQFEVFVTQDDVTRTARVREVGVVSTSKPAADSPATDNVTPATDPMASATLRTVLTFTVPTGLHEGEATAVLAYRGRRSDAYTFNVVSHPPTPHVFVPFMTGAMSSRLPRKMPDDLKEKSKQAARLERGQSAMLLVSPLADPEAVDVAVLVTFKQEHFQREVTAEIISHEPVEVGDNSIRLGAQRYEVRVQTPADLGIGPAEIEARLRVNGMVSDPGKTSVQITDAFAGSPVDSAPRVINFQPEKVGIGQAVHLFVDDPRRLQPEPDKVVAVLEQEGRRVELKPERNSALYGAGEQSPLTFLVVRVGKEITGKATLRVWHPVRGAAGLSEAISIEILDEVQAPEVIKVSDATKQDIAQLSTMREQVMKAGRTFAEYDPKYRYVTIRANRLDYSPNHTRIVFQQGGKSYTLQYEDYSLSMGDHIVVRLPEPIKPGEVTVTIQNRGAGRLSAPVVRVFEVTQPSKQ